MSITLLLDAQLLQIWYQIKANILACIPYT